MYLDDIVIISRNADEHTLHIRAVILLLHKAGVKVFTLMPALCKKLKKGKLLTKMIDSLWHTIWTDKLELDDHTTCAIRDCRPPHHVTKLK